MKKFELTSSMVTMGGVFYPRGYAVVMLPSAGQAEQVARELEGSAKPPKEVMLLDPQTIIRDIAKVKDDSDLDLPSVGTEGATVRKYVKLAREGHHGIMVPVDSSEEAEALMEIARKAEFSYAQRYQLLAIQDLE